ncbi:RluA family pseudouridine synthase [Alkalihalobacterium bogoriense]|uniref:RluA family pseudouridine synthase n=1 Tax=Alkalihalobacterium bogoriense TaxID=246272 RepID=UPI0005589260|nr:RluA family pseudouridine synthase [Alkalihalobacterium bogoriense]
MVNFSWKVTTKEQGLLLREFLREEKAISKGALADIKYKGGNIAVNGIETTVRKKLQAGDTVTIKFPPEQRSPTLLSENIDIQIVYEDDYFLVVNKQAGMPTIPSWMYPSKTLANAVLGYYDQHNIDSTFHAVNRLDKDTSGLVLIAKHRYAHDLMSTQQKQGHIQRVYFAVVHGKLIQKEFQINAKIGRKDGSIIEREVREDGQHALTNVVVRKADKDHSVVEVKLSTGRTHQIRVHFSSIGHPLLGDDLYGGTLEKIQRQALHSWKMRFLHPFTKEEIELEQHPPQDIQRAIEQE